MNSNYIRKNIIGHGLLTKDSLKAPLHMKRYSPALNHKMVFAQANYVVYSKTKRTFEKVPF